MKRPAPTPGSERLRVVCAWCRRVIREPAPGAAAAAHDSHGMCLACARALGVFPTEDFFALGAAEYDRLPFGLVELDAAGRVRAYNAAEASISGLDPRRIIGKAFFAEVAPCTRVRAFQGAYEALVARGGGVEPPFQFLFRFAGGDRLIEITLAYDAARQRGQLHMWELAG